MPSLSELLAFSKYSNAVVKTHEEANDYSFLALLRDSTNIQANVLYICNGEIPDAVNGFSSCGIVLLSDHAHFDDSAFENLSCEYCIIEESDSISALCNFQDALISSGRKKQIWEVARRSVVNRLSLNTKVKQICEILGNPIAVYDASYNVLSMESLGKPVDNKVWIMAQKTGSFSQDIVRDFRNAIGNRDIAHEPFLCTTHSWTNIHCLVMQLLSKNGDVLGSVAIYESFKAFSPEDISIVRDIAAILSEHIENNLIENDSKVQQEKLLSEIIDGAVFDPETIQQKTNLCGWTEHKFYRLGFIGLGERKTLQRQREYFCSVFAKISPDIFAFSKDKNIIILICIEDKQRATSLIEQIEHVLDKNSLSMALSGYFLSLNDLRKAFSIAQETLSSVSKLLGKSSIYYAQDMSVYFLLSNLDSHSIKKLFEMTSFYAIRCYDDLHQTKYCDTLITYCTNMFRSNQTAYELYIHKNSLFYRLDRINSLFGINIDDFHDIFDFWLGYKLSLFLNNESRRSSVLF